MGKITRAALGMAVLGALAAATPAAAQTRPRAAPDAATSCPTGPVTNPYTLKAEHGKYAPFANFIRPDDYYPILAQPDGRYAYWHYLGCVHGSPYGYWRAWNGEVFAASDDCTHWELKPKTRDYGTVTIDLRVNGAIYFASRACNPDWQQAGGVTWVWGHVDRPGSFFTGTDRNNPKRGLLLAMVVCDRHGRNCHA